MSPRENFDNLTRRTCILKQTLPLYKQPFLQIVTNRCSLFQTLYVFSCFCFGAAVSNNTCYANSVEKYMLYMFLKRSVLLRPGHPMHFLFKHFQ